MSDLTHTAITVIIADDHVLLRKMGRWRELQGLHACKQSFKMILTQKQFTIN
jgi:hypothetical protein